VERSIIGLLLFISLGFANEGEQGQESLPAYKCCPGFFVKQEVINNRVQDIIYYHGNKKSEPMALDRRTLEYFDIYDDRKAKEAWMSFTSSQNPAAKWQFDNEDPERNLRLSLQIIPHGYVKAAEMTFIESLASKDAFDLLTYTGEINADCSGLKTDTLLPYELYNPAPTSEGYKHITDGNHDALCGHESAKELTKDYIRTVIEHKKRLLYYVNKRKSFSFLNWLLQSAYADDLDIDDLGDDDLDLDDDEKTFEDQNFTKEYDKNKKSDITFADASFYEVKIMEAIEGCNDQEKIHFDELKQAVDLCEKSGNCKMKEVVMDNIAANREKKAQLIKEGHQLIAQNQETIENINDPKENVNIRERIEPIEPLPMREIKQIVNTEETLTKAAEEATRGMLQSLKIKIESEEKSIEENQTSPDDDILITHVSDEDVALARAKADLQRRDVFSQDENYEATFNTHFFNGDKKTEIYNKESYYNTFLRKGEFKDYSNVSEEKKNAQITSDLIVESKKRGKELSADTASEIALAYQEKNQDIVNFDTVFGATSKEDFQNLEQNSEVKEMALLAAEAQEEINKLKKEISVTENDTEIEIKKKEIERLEAEIAQNERKINSRVSSIASSISDKKESYSNSDGSGNFTTSSPSTANYKPRINSGGSSGTRGSFTPRSGGSTSPSYTPSSSKTLGDNKNSSSIPSTNKHSEQEPPKVVNDKEVKKSEQKTITSSIKNNTEGEDEISDSGVKTGMNSPSTEQKIHL
jgi:uncharacterized small protein (DUF1192 family)